MTVPVILRPAAQADVRQAYLWLEQAAESLGDRFKMRLAEAPERIELNPETYGIVWEDVRAVRLRKFRFVVYYVIFTDRVEVLAVLHGSRHESTWKSRV